ncbi:esterase/lipase family protein [uncultured Hymenobacter sp.]|uniref:esterase/lipase family protein n=1 Tax=uncultured Hymenobacter sp. TaxID=170016 RepID=UPI0035C9470D
MPSRFGNALRALGRAAAIVPRGAAYAYRAGQAHQHFFLPVLNGALGDQLAARYDARAIQMSFRRGGRDVPVAALRLQEARLKTVVFVHGLMGDELIWQTGFQDAAGRPRFGPRLAQEAGLRCLYLRYNTGQHLSENGRELARLLQELADRYPDALGELVLVGHSMGGLIIRSAGYYGSEQLAVSSEQLTNDSAAHCLLLTGKATWLAHLRAVFLLGTPHDGAWLEQNSHLTERLLRRINLFPTRFLSNALNQRSNGIKDLRHAWLVDEDWQGPHAADLLPPRTAVPLLPGVHYHVLMGAWLRSSLPAVLREYFGDGMVGAASARGQATFGDEAALPAGTSVRTAIFPQQHHGGLLTHPEVYQYLKAHA